MVRKYGILGGLSETNDKDATEYIRFKKNARDARNALFDRIRVFYGKNDGPCMLQLLKDGEVADTEILQQAQTLAQHSFTISPDAKTVELQLAIQGGEHH